MVLRCSLLGHDYGESEVEREREERGSEVVVTVEEYEECARCGDRNVLSENTEVTSLPTETETSTPTAAPNDSDTDTAAVPTDSPSETRADSSETDSAVAAESADDDDLATDPDHPTDENGEPITDDAEILEDDDGDEPRDPERGRGEWPDSDDVGPPVGSENEPAAWPESDEDARDGGGGAVDDPQSTESGSDTTLGLDASEPVSGGTASDSDSGSDSGPDHGTEPTDDAVFVDADPEADVSHPATDSGSNSNSNSNSDSGTGITSAQSAPAPGEGSSAPDGVPTEFYCPRCEFVAPGDRGSLRTGDICPDCRKGYLGERER